MIESNKRERGVDISVRPIDEQRERKRVQEKRGEDRLSELFNRLGGDGILRFFRWENEKWVWIKGLPVTDDLVQNLEETVSRMWGGGCYKLEGRKGSEYVGIAEINIDERLYPPKRKGADGKFYEDVQFHPGAAPAAAPAAPAVDPMAIVGLLSKAQESGEQRARTAAETQTAMVVGMCTTMMQMQAQSTQALIGVLTGRGQPSGPTLEQQTAAFKNVAEAMSIMREAMPDGGGVEDPPWLSVLKLAMPGLMPLVPRVLELAAPKPAAPAQGAPPTPQVVPSAPAAFSPSPVRPPAPAATPVSHAPPAPMPAKNEGQRPGPAHMPGIEGLSPAKMDEIRRQRAQRRG